MKLVFVCCRCVSVARAQRLQPGGAGRESLAETLPAWYGGGGASILPGPAHRHHHAGPGSSATSALLSGIMEGKNVWNVSLCSRHSLTLC